MKKVTKRISMGMGIFFASSAAVVALAQTVKSTAVLAPTTRAPEIAGSAPPAIEAPERAVSVVNQTVQMKRNTSPTGAVAKQIGPSGQGLKEIVVGIDNGVGVGSGAQATITPDIKGSFAINPTGTTWTFSPDVTIPSANWNVKCENKTSFFNNALGQTVSDDVVTTSPATVLMSGGKATVTCPYKKTAHLLNIAKKVEASAVISVTSFSAGNVAYAASVTLAGMTCTRNSKVDNLSCS